MGSLHATTTIAVQTVIDENEDNANGAWDAIQARFGQHNAISVWADFKSIMEFRLSGGNPVPKIARLKLLFNQLAKSDIKLPDLIKAMLLLNSIPHTCVAHETIVNHYKARKPAPLATHISSDKKKDKDPKFQQQTSSSSSSNNTSNNSSNNDQKKKNQRHGMKNKGNNQDNKGGSNQGHSHIASFAHLGISSPESPSITHPANRNCGPLHMQRFSNATTCCHDSSYSPQQAPKSTLSAKPSSQFTPFPQMSDSTP
ncbi:hypothetical protein PQX77_021525 [Marasmius sp. AFHP31]|nr:hypothetical protein PQX77_021525 [Marasmius sp. AFHP31]